MEGVSTKAHNKGLRGFWQRKGYEKLNEEGRRRGGNNKLEPAGSTSTRRRRRFSWRTIRIKPKLQISRLLLPSPKKFFIWLRDAYVKMMMGFANSRVCASGYGGGGDIGGTGGAYAFGRGPLKEYDEKMIVEIYKSMAMQRGHMVPRDAAKLGSLGSFSRT